MSLDLGRADNGRDFFEPGDCYGVGSVRIAVEVSAPLAVSFLGGAGNSACFRGLADSSCFFSGLIGLILYFGASGFYYISIYYYGACLLPLSALLTFS